MASTKRKHTTSFEHILLKRFSAIVWLSFFVLSTRFVFLPYSHESNQFSRIKVPKIFAQELPDGENIAPTAKELFTNDMITGIEGIPFTSNNVILHGPRNTKRIALTFDADMTPWMRESIQSGAVQSSFDKRIITILNQNQTKATFFLAGMWIELYRNDVQKLSKNPLFAFGNHSYSHPSFEGSCYGLEQIPDSEDITQVTKTNILLRETTGRDVTLFRFPGGCYGQTDLSIVTKYTGMSIVHWDVVGDDGFNNNVWQIERNVIDHVQNGSIIILHMNGAPNAPHTADALPTIIDTLKRSGYTFVTVPELLNLSSS